jgi:hypothetical protein
MRLMLSRRFAPLFWCQFFSAFNDNFLRTTLVLFILFAGLMITFRFGRFFFPRSTPPPSKTQYVDAWAESAKRVSIPDEADDDEPHS